MGLTGLIFETERLLARELTLEDAEDVFQIYGDPKVTRYVTSDGEPVGDAAVARYLLEQGMLARQPDPRFGFWGLLRKTDKVLVGTVALVASEGFPGEYELGWHLKPEHWGSGYATESGRGLISYGFDVAGIEEILALVHPENERSLRACERLGMRRAAPRLQHGYEHVCFIAENRS